MEGQPFIKKNATCSGGKGISLAKAEVTLER